MTAGMTAREGRSPDAWDPLEPRGRLVEPEDRGHREEAVRVGSASLVVAVPFLPLAGEGGGVGACGGGSGGGGCVESGHVGHCHACVTASRVASSRTAERNIRSRGRDRHRHGSPHKLPRGYVDASTF